MARRTTVNTISAAPPPDKLYVDPACVVPNYCKLTDEEKALANAQAKRIQDDFTLVYYPSFPVAAAKPPGYDCAFKVEIPPSDVPTYQLSSALCPIGRTPSNGTAPPTSGFQCVGNCYAPGLTSNASVGYRLKASIDAELYDPANPTVTLFSWTFNYDSFLSNNVSGSQTALKSPFKAFIRSSRQNLTGGVCNTTVPGGVAVGSARPVPNLFVYNASTLVGSLSLELAQYNPLNIPCTVSVPTAALWRVIRIFNVEAIPVSTESASPCEAPGYNDNVEYQYRISLMSDGRNPLNNYTNTEANNQHFTEQADTVTGVFFGAFGGTRWIANGANWTLQIFARASVGATPTWINTTLLSAPAQYKPEVWITARVFSGGIYPSEIGDPAFAPCIKVSGQGSGGSAIVYRNNEKIDSHWSGDGTLTIPRDTGTVVVSQAYQTMYETPMLVSGSISNIKRMKHLYVHFWNPPNETIDSPGRTIRDANVTVITDYGYEDQSASPSDVYGVNREIFQSEEALSLADKQNNPYLNFKLPLQGSAYGYQMGIWNVDEKSWAIDGFEFQFDVYDHYRQKHRSE